MKYGKYWTDLTFKFSTEYQSYFLNYKKWKKRTKEYDDDFLSKIEKECDNIDSFYKKRTSSLLQKTHRSELSTSGVQDYLMEGYLGKKGLQLLLSAFTNRNDQSNASHTRNDSIEENENEYLLHIKIVNKQSLYKLCKRFDKKSGLKNVYTYWFHNVAKKKYDFLKMDMTHRFLEWRVHNRRDTCPICLEDDYEDFVIQNCGHIICTNCIKQLAGSRRNQTTGVRGTLYNIIRNLQYHHNCDCPICRTCDALSHFKIVSKSGVICNGSE